MSAVMGQLVVLSDKAAAACYYRMATQYARQKATYLALQCMVESFLARFGEMRCQDSLWLDFYQGQFMKYLRGKHHFCCSLPEGDMIHDYLRDCYEQILRELAESQIPFKGNVRAYLYSRNLDFPTMEIEEESF